MRKSNIEELSYSLVFNGITHFDNKYFCVLDAHHEAREETKAKEVEMNGGEAIWMDSWNNLEHIKNR